MALDGYVKDGEWITYQVRPCGKRHSLKLICKKCVKARELARSQAKANPIIPHLRLWIFRRDSWLCVECGSDEDLTVDHIHPVILGGKTDPDNLRTLCRSCNSSKGSQIVEG